MVLGSLLLSHLRIHFKKRNKHNEKRRGRGDGGGFFLPVPTDDIDIRVMHLGHESRSLLGSDIPDPDSLICRARSEDALL
jgi:hypothetical protein